MSMMSNGVKTAFRRVVGDSSSWAVIVLVMVVLSMAVASVPFVGTGSASSSSPVATHLSAGSRGAPPGTATSSPARPIPAAPPGIGASSSGPTATAKSLIPSSGRGIFFNSTQLQNPTVGNQTCHNVYLYYAGVCTNNTNSPVLVHTSQGYYVAAYNAATNQSGCASTRSYATTEIGISVSKGSPTNWTTPSYLVDSSCSNATHTNDYPSAWSPTMVALPNGTLALAYIEYNWSVGNFSAPGCYDVFPEIYTLQCLTYDRLVFTESFNNGTSWTAPVVINQSAPNLGRNSTGMQDPQMPSLAAYGNTLYLAWENLTDPPYYSASSQIHLVVSTNGGRSWGSMINLRVEAGSYYGTKTDGATAPNLLVSPSGELFIAYDTNYTTVSNYCQGGNCGETFTVTVTLARSTNNGSSFNYSKIQTVPAGNVIGYWYPLVMTAPKLAYSSFNDKLYAVYSGGLFGKYCYYYSSPPYCYTGETPTSLWFDSSSNNGTTWGTGWLAFPSVSGSTFSAESAIYNPSIVVSASGEVYIQASYLNYTQCFTLFGYSGYCGQTLQLFGFSLDNGTTFSGPYTVSGNIPNLSGSAWDGFQSTMLLVNSNPVLAWSQTSCPVWNVTGACFWPYTYGNTHIEISQLYNGTGYTLAFQESHLPSAENWSVSLLGNERAGPAGTSLVISGVPPNLSGPFTVPWVNVSYGAAYVPTATPSSPVLVSSPTTNVTIDFQESFLVTVSTVPPPMSFGNAFACNPLYYYNDYCANQAVTPTPGPSWHPANSTLAYSITALSTSMATCYACMNLSFQSWTGTGNGSFTTTNPNGTTTVRGPINETANFKLLNICDYGVCTAINYSYNFTETGLPNGTLWGLTFNGSTSYTNLTYQDFDTTISPVNFTAWTVYYNATEVYVPTTTAQSPLSPITGNFVLVHYHLENISGLMVNLTIGETGLPQGSQWSFSFGNQVSFGVQGSTHSPISLMTGTYFLNASIVYTQTGVAYYPSLVHVASYETGAVFGNFTSSIGANVSIRNWAQVTILYLPEYQFSASAGVGGSVSPNLLWAHPGQTINVTASPDAGYTFVHWTGTGVGSVTSTNASIEVTVRGVVTEVATFRLIVPVYHVTISSSGLPLGTPLTLRLGNLSYTGTSPFTVTNLTRGTYSLATPTLYSSLQAGTRYVQTGLTTTLPMTGFAVQISANGTITITYTTQYLVQIGSAPNGTSSPSAGTYWNDSGTALVLTAMPIPGFYKAVGWNGTYNVTGAILSINLTEPIYETPTFAAYTPAPPATYSLTIREAGLPAGTSWNAIVGVTGLSSSGVSISISGLNGTYNLEIPTVSGATGVRYVASPGTPLSVDVSANSTLQVNFTTQYLVTLQSSAGGNLSQPTQWLDAGASITVVATPQSGYHFVNWTGTGSGSYTGRNATINITAMGPLTELAGFAPNNQASGGNSNGGLTAGSAAISFGLLVVLLVVGLVVAFVIRRSQSPKSKQGGSKTPPSSGASSAASQASTTPGGKPATPPSSSEPMTIFQGPGSKK
jgi:hypothetical protein